MAYEVLARKWRPQVFEDVIGQEHITQTLINAIKSERVAHAYLFSGARGVGKTSVARILAKALSCQQGEPGIPCNQCSSCLEITRGASTDVQEIDGASNRGIDEIRNLRENIKYLPSGGRFRVYIIDEVHMLTLPAFNALLKTLEEPPPHVKFIFATTEPHKVPITILSRCQRFDFKRIPMARMVDLLKKITTEEGIEISPKGLMLLARESEGSMRDAESLLDQVISYTGAKVEDKAITDILGIIDRTILAEITRAIIENQPGQCLEIIERIYNYGYDLKEFYHSLMDQFRNLLVGLIVPGGELLDMIESERVELKTLADRAGQERLQQSLSFLIAKEAGLRFTANPRLVLEAIVIKLCHLDKILPVEQLLQRLAELETRLPAINAPAGRPPMTGPARPVGYAPEPKKSSGPAVGTPPVAASGPVSVKNEDWNDFQGFVASKSKPMSNVIKSWHLTQVRGDSLEISSTGDSFTSGYFNDPDNLVKLETLAHEYFKRPLKIKPVAATVGKEPAKTAPVPEKTAKASPAKTEFGQPVQDILDLFQGKVKEENGQKK
ncbi:MAG: DNA polymerase III subunit gamma/tau [Desulfobacteraceae bacterium]|nr:MAG: DNA polymerase III subunit gamma/tau [Desulfobacteraceae bacterium]